MRKDMCLQETQLMDREEMRERNLLSNEGERTEERALHGAG